MIVSLVQAIAKIVNSRFTGVDRSGDADCRSDEGEAHVCR